MKAQALRPRTLWSSITAAGLLVAITVLCDQILKHLVRTGFQRNNELSYFGDCVRVLHAENPGAFLGLAGDFSARVRFWALGVSVAISLGVLVGFAAWLLRAKRINRLSGTGLSLIAAGGIGNLIDRLAHGTVTDFLFLHLGPFRTGVFNLADVAISLGVILLFFSTSALPNRPEKTAN